jgi:hypothetical protein
MGENPMQQIADILSALSRIFGDPNVQDRATGFMNAFTVAADRELGPVLDRRELGK